MSISDSPRFTVVVTAAVSLLAGCNGGSQLAPATDQSAAQQASKISGHRPNFSVTRSGVLIQHPNHSSSHMMKPLAGQKLLYVSDPGFSDVEVFDYPQGTPVGTLTGFSYPQGECTDKSGNVYVVDSGASQIVEFAYGGTTPIAILSDPNKVPASCAVDPSTGNLAVSNILDFNYFEIGSISIYSNASGNPTIYTDPDNAREYFLTYDNNSNLFVDGVDSATSAFRYAKMSPDGTFTEIKLKGAKLTFPGGVQSIGNYIAVGDQDGAVFGTPDVYRVSPSGKVLGRVTLVGASGGRVGDLVQFTITPNANKAKKIIAPDAIGASTYIDNWPQGTFVSDINAGLLVPIGTAISKPPGT